MPTTQNELDIQMIRRYMRHEGPSPYDVAQAVKRIDLQLNHTRYIDGVYVLNSAKGYLITNQTTDEEWVVSHQTELGCKIRLFLETAKNQEFTDTLYEDMYHRAMRHQIVTWCMRVIDEGEPLEGDQC